MKTITVSLDKNLGYISDAMFSLLTELFEKTNPAVLQISKDEAEKIFTELSKKNESDDSANEDEKNSETKQSENSANNGA